MSQSRFHTAVDFHRNGQLAQAEQAYRQLLAQQPHHADALHYLGLLCHQSGRSQEAANLLQKALQIQPDDVACLNNYGAVLRATGALSQAIETYRKALQHTPRDIDLLQNLGNALLDTKQLEAACDCYRRVLQQVPGHQEVRLALVQALSAWGFNLHTSGSYQQAEAVYTEAVRLAPEDGALFYNLANAQRELGKPAQALYNYNQALARMPNDADIHNNLGNVLREMGQLEDAIAAYRRALELNPQLHHALVHLVHQKQHICEWSDLEQEITQIRRWFEDTPHAQISPFAFLAMPGTTAAEQRRCASQWVTQRISPLSSQALPSPAPHNSNDKIRIGYLSSDFRLHPLAFLITELLELHDRQQFEVTAYSNAADDKTPERQRLEKSVDHFVDIRHMGPHAAASKIREDHIDILVDLTGFTHNSRSEIAALRPARLHINWLGYPGTMGDLSENRPLFDYLLTDAFITPQAQATQYAEQLLYLPHCYQPNDRKRPVAIAPTRAECGLPEHGFVFCCFNQTFKILPSMFDIWMRLLSARADSVLWLLDCNAIAKKNLLREAEVRGIAADRLVFAPRVPIAQHLARHVHADLVLDTLPYNAHTTASDALWMGVPLLTCVGDTFPGRVAASMLHSMGLETLIAHSLQEYEQQALRLSTDQVALMHLKSALAQMKSSSPLFDTDRFTCDLENCYRMVLSASMSAT